MLGIFAVFGDPYQSECTFMLLLGKQMRDDRVVCLEMLDHMKSVCGDRLQL